MARACGLILWHMDGQGRESVRGNDTVHWTCLEPVLDRTWLCLVSDFFLGLINLPLTFVYTIINKLTIPLMEPEERYIRWKNALLNLDFWVQRGCFSWDVIYLKLPWFVRGTYSCTSY